MSCVTIFNSPSKWLVGKDSKPHKQNVSLKRNWRSTEITLDVFHRYNDHVFHGHVVGEVQAYLGDKITHSLKSELSWKAPKIPQYCRRPSYLKVWVSQSLPDPVPAPLYDSWRVGYWGYFPKAEGIPCWVLSFIFLSPRAGRASYVIAQTRINTASKDTFLWCYNLTNKCIKI